MPRTRLTLSALMIAVAVIAFELATWRAILGGPMFRRIAVAPIVVAAHAALWGAARRGGAARGFWAGSAASGLLAALSLARYAAPGGPRAPGPWHAYFQAVGRLREQRPDSLRARIDGDWWARAATVLVYTAVPQLVIAALGGFVVAAAFHKRMRVERGASDVA